MFPDAEAAHRAAGEAYLAAARYKDALTCFDWIVERSPDVLAQLKRGFALAALGDYGNSTAAFAKAKNADTQAVEKFCISLSGRSEAPSVLDPRAIHLWALYLAQCECDWSGRDALVDALRHAGESGVAANEPALAFVSLLLPTTQAERYALARSVAARIEARCPPLPPPPQAPAGTSIRVGILSPDYHEHLNAYILLPLFELADRRRFELYAYSLGPDDGSAIRGRIRRAAHRFRDLRLLDSRAAAEQMRRDGIDILVDVGGYSSGARFDIAACRPARAQALYLGFSGTLGSRRTDYVIADRTVLPPEDAVFWSEAPVYVPHTWFLYDFRAAPAALPRADRAMYGLPLDVFVFSAFHRAEKIEPDSFDLWMRILKQVPDSVLWLYADEGRVRENIRREASVRGVEPQRLVFAAREPRAAHLARFALADLLLDSLQHNATTTACDAFSVGVPMLTLRGRTFTGRIGESLLRAAGLPELVSPDKEAFVSQAVQLASDAARLERYHRTLVARTGPLFDTPARVREIEAALMQMWRQYEQREDRDR